MKRMLQKTASFSAFSTLSAIGLALALASPADAALLGTYEFTGQSLAITDADAGDGVTFTDMDLHNYGNLFDNGSDGNSLRISGDDNGASGSTSDATTAGYYLSFKVTNNSGAVLDLTSLTLDYKATNANGFSASRVYASSQGFDNVTADTIARVGRLVAGSDASVVNAVVDLDDLSNNVDAGINASSSPGDYNLLNGFARTFYIVWIDDSGHFSRYTDIDNIALYSAGAASIPEPATLGMLSVGALLMLKRRGVRGHDV